jgi:putative heme transporter
VARRIDDLRRGPSIRIELSVRTLLKVALGVAACWLAIKLWVVILTLVIAMMIVFAMARPVEWLQHKGLGRVPAVAVAFGGLFVATIGFGALTIPPLFTQIGRIVKDAPTHQEHLFQWVEARPMLGKLTGPIRQADPSQSIRGGVRYLMSMAPGALAVIAYGFTAIFLAIYFMADRERMRGVVYALVPRTWHVRFARVCLKLETIVGGYIRGQVITSALMGIFLFTLLTIFGVPNALAIAALGAAGDVIPYVGVLFTILPAALAALSKGTGTAIAVAAMCATYQELENRFIVPRVYGRVLRLPSAAVLVALLVGGVLGGVLGAILALPFAAALRMLVEELRLALPGDDTTATEVRARDAEIEQEFERRAAGRSPHSAAYIAVSLAKHREAADESDR